jgi:4'-phosphopantetheinyl transferase
VWRAHLDQNVDSLSELTNVLSPDELERAARFRLARDRDRFVLSRGLLRRILSLYLWVDPKEIRFSYGLFDKPFLDSRWHERPLSFNLAHAGQMALYAITRRRSVGVDLEFVEPLPDLEAVARQFFSSRELDRLHRLSNDQRLLAFFIGWTRKEAYLKASGQGLTRSPDQVEVCLESFRTSVLDTVDSEEGMHRFWRIETVFPAPGYAGAVAAEGDDWRIRWLDWQACRALGRPRQMEYS